MWWDVRGWVCVLERGDLCVLWFAREGSKKPDIPASFAPTSIDPSSHNSCIHSTHSLDMPPELRGREPPMHNHRPTGGKRGEEAGDKPVYVEEGHHEEGPVFGGQFVGGLCLCLCV